MPFTKEASLYNLFHQDKDYKREAELIHKKFPKARNILEIGAGTGLLSKELANLGYDVTAVEPSLDMLKMWRDKRITRINKKIQDIPVEYFYCKEFDLILCMYDVLNYIPENEFEEQINKLAKWGRKTFIELWNSDKGVKLFTHKQAGGWHRVRIGIRIKDTAYLWFIYFGKGFLIEKHTLYL